MRIAMRARVAALAAWSALALPGGASAQEVFAGLYAHGVDTPFTLYTGEEGADLAIGVRLAPIEALRPIGAPAPCVIGSVNSVGDTSFAGAGLSWRFGQGPVYVRPAVALVVHDGPEYRADAERGQRTDLGSRVLFEPELGIGYQVNERLSVEASWMHISQGRLFNWEQNPGVDMMGARVNWRLR